MLVPRVDVVSDGAVVHTHLETPNLNAQTMLWTPCALQGLASYLRQERQELSDIRATVLAVNSTVVRRKFKSIGGYKADEC